MLGALYRQTEIHPVDYLHHALNMDINFLEHATPEYEQLIKYVKNTHQNMINFDTHKINIFKIERKGEAENFQEFSEIGNTRLLFHGSSLFNFVGILS